MQSRYDAEFEREMGCTEAEWLGWLPGACKDHPLTIDGRSAEIAIAGGRLRLDWSPLPARRIALMTMPRLAVRFRFEDIDAHNRLRFMRYFDLHMQRGGG
jgi:hypothetical protein